MHGFITTWWKQLHDNTHRSTGVCNMLWQWKREGFKFLWNRCQLYFKQTVINDHRRTCSSLTICIYDSTESLSVLTAISRWTWVSRSLLKQRMMEMAVTTGAISRPKHHQIISTNKPTPSFFVQTGCRLPCLSSALWCQYPMTQLSE